MAREATGSALAINTSLVEGGAVIGTKIAAAVAVVLTSRVVGGAAGGVGVGEALVEGCREEKGEIPTT
jgi:hypothetical protein